MQDEFLLGLRRLAAMGKADLGQPWLWEGNPGPALTWRDACYQALERGLGMAGEPKGEAQRALLAGQVAARDLYGLVVGLSDSDLDRTPGEGRTPRRILTHVVHIERRYRIQTRSPWVGKPRASCHQQSPPRKTAKAA